MTCCMCGSKPADFDITRDPWDDPIARLCEACVRKIAPREMAEHDRVQRRMYDRNQLQSELRHALRAAQTRQERKAVIMRAAAMGIDI